MTLKLTPIRLVEADSNWIDEFVQEDSNSFETRSNFIRVAIKDLIKKEKTNGSTKEDDR